MAPAPAPDTITSARPLPANAPAKDARIPANSTSRWLQNDQDDKMTHKKMYFATLSATEGLHLGSGVVDAQLMLKYKNDKNEAVLRLDKGSFSKKAANTSLRVLFDSVSTEKYPAEVSPYMANCILIKNPDQLIAKLKTSKRVIIDADIDNEAHQKIIFDVAGLDWKH